MQEHLGDVDYNFNSSVVRLRDAKEVVRTMLQAGFQFQCGAIEGKLLQFANGAMYEFQFQCGAIEGKKLSEKNSQLTKFQFQCGAIEGDYARL